MGAYRLLGHFAQPPSCTQYSSDFSYELRSGIWCLPFALPSATAAVIEQFGLSIFRDENVSAPHGAPHFTVTPTGGERGGGGLCYLLLQMKM